MPDDVGGRPFPDGWEPDDDRGGADEDFAPVVFDEDFVRAARFHEPTAVERLVAAAQARADADPAGARGGGSAAEDDPYAHGYAYADDEYGPVGAHDPYGPYGGALRPYRPGGRWYRPVAWIVALLMGLGMVALAFTAVYRSSSTDHDEQTPLPATTDAPTPAASASPAYSPPTAPALPGTS